jgi:hypothetical protein
MLIEQFVVAARPRLVKGAFGPGAAKSRTIGGSLLLRTISRRALLELFQVDQIAHCVPRHAGLDVVETMQSIELSGFAPAGSILIIKFLIMPPDCKCRASIFLENIFCCTTA